MKTFFLFVLSYKPNTMLQDQDWVKLFWPSKFFSARTATYHFMGKHHNFRIRWGMVKRFTNTGLNPFLWFESCAEIINLNQTRNFRVLKKSKHMFRNFSKLMLKSDVLFCFVF